MRTELVSLLTLAILLAAGIAFYASREVREPEPESNVPALEPDASTSTDQSPDTNSVPDESISLPERTFQSESTDTPIFSDVPESELNHQVLEEFLAIKPIAAYRIVRIDSDALRTRIRQLADFPEIEIQLIDSDLITLISRTATEHSAGWQSGFSTWRGAVRDDETSRASFVVSPDGTVNGVVRSREIGRVKIEAIEGTQHHIIWSLGEYTGPIERID